ncbi:MAG: hypothetical protein JRG82_16330 [Deltaproteobacteria bacterium]|nr:hypothetical protein [Deltaproteobacteria bacterium]
MIGLATGTWGQIVAHHPDLEHLTIVEINPGYLELIARYPTVQSLLHNPKVEILTDDARRWLNRHPHARFDFIFQNTSQDYRANATNLLSMEFLALVRRHLQPGGVFYYNTQIARRSMRTACTAFPYGMRLHNHMAVSERPLDFDPDRLFETLARYEIDGQPVIDPDNARHRKQLRIMRERMGTLGNDEEGYLEDCESILARTEGFPLVTDDNIATEWVVPPRGEPAFEYLIEQVKDSDMPVWLSR